jgi:16S rRNA A1518/A1519 N6-dimethyltransferase RsmA/KsgA/DIM1 with predicted DNA glycosylase/AP lyase activity
MARKVATRLTRPAPSMNCALVRRWFVVQHRKLDIAAHQRAAFIGDAAFQRRRKRADNGNRTNTENQAGQKNAEALKAGSQFAPGQTESNGERFRHVS